FEYPNPALCRLVDFLNIVKGLLRAARFAFDGEKVFPLAAELEKGLSTSLAADPEPPLATDDLSLRRPDLNRQLPHTLHHPILQHSMQVDGLHLLHDLIANRIDLLLNLLLFRGIAVGMPNNFIETLERGRTLPDGIQPFERLHPKLFVALLDLFFLKLLLRLDDRNNLTHVDGPILELVVQREDKLNRHRHPIDDRGDVLLPFLDAFRDLDFSFATQQRHTSHFLQIEANRVVGPAECAGS